MIRKQKLVAVQVDLKEEGETITLAADGKPVEELLTAWRIVGMESLGPKGDGYAALLLLEELPPENRAGRLGFEVE